MNIKKNVKFVLAYNQMRNRAPGTIGELATMLSVDSGNLSRWLSSGKGVRLTIEAVSNALGVTVTQLVTGNM